MLAVVGLGTGSAPVEEALGSGIPLGALIQRIGGEAKRLSPRSLVWAGLRTGLLDLVRRGMKTWVPLELTRYAYLPVPLLYA